MIVRSVMAMILCVMVVTLGSGVARAQGAGAVSSEEDGAERAHGRPAEHGHADAPDHEDGADSREEPLRDAPLRALAEVALGDPVEPQEQRHEADEQGEGNGDQVNRGWPWAETWAGIAAGAAVVMAGISWVALDFLRKTFGETRKAVRAARRANKVVRDMGIAQTRAYIDVERLAFRHKQKEFRLDIRNGGHSPARWYAVTLAARFEVVSTGLDPMPEVIFDDGIDMPPLRTWSGPPAQTSWSNIWYDDASAEAVHRSLSLSGILIVQGRIEWATMFNETFASEFLFHTTIARAAIERSVTDETVRKCGLPLSRTPGVHRIAWPVERD